MEKMEETCDEHGAEVKTAGAGRRNFVANQQPAVAIWYRIIGKRSLSFCRSIGRSRTEILAGTSGWTNKLWR